ncbi:MAG: hypothetical protein JWM82_2982, partial [Myxococcales bacterium]|nr:hypothetical protein [Myxococcales bacterium]
MSMLADRRSGFCLLLALALSLGSVACGRQDLDFTDPNPNALPVTTGGAGSGATAGTAATAGT